MMITDTSLIKYISYELQDLLNILQKQRHEKPIKLFKCFAFTAIG